MKNFISIVFFFYLSSFSAFADKEIKSDNHLSAQKKITLRVAIEDAGYFPFNYKEDGKIKGFSIDVLSYFEENSNYNFEFVIRPWPRSLYLVAQGDIDLILTLFKNPEREQTYHFIEPSYAYEVSQLFTLANYKLNYDGQLNQLTPYSIGTTREYLYGKTFDKADYLTKLPVLNEEVLLKLLLAKRVDMIIANPLVFNQIAIRKNVSNEIKSITPYIALTPVYMALTKGREDSQEIKTALKQLTQQFITSHYYQELLDKYQLNR